MKIRLHVSCLPMFLVSSSVVIVVLLLIPHLLLYHMFSFPSFTLCISFPPFVLLYFLLLAFPGIFSSSLWLPSFLFHLPPSFPPSQHVKLGTFLRNNAITSMDASHYACVCVCVSLCACDTVTVAQTLPGGKHGCSLLFLLLFPITVCFINAMVIGFALLLWSLYLVKCRKAQRTPIDLSSSRDPVPLIQLLPCQSFMNAAGRKWPLGNSNRQFAQNKGLET